MVILITILCLSASPLSAILMIPIPGWWMDHSYKDFFVFYTKDMIHGSILDSESGPLVNESIGALAATTREISTTFLSTTFSGDLRPIYSYPGLNQQAAQLLNISFSNYAARFRRTSVGLLGGLVIATCPLSSIASSLGDFGTINLDEELATSPPLLITAERESANSTKLGRWKQPLLVTTCSRGSLDGDLVSFWFKSSLLDKTLTLNVESDSALAELNKKHQSTPGPLGYRYLNLRQTRGWPVSADILFGNRTDALDSFNAEYHLCLIFARWIEADVWMEPSTSADIFVHLPFPTTESLEKVKDSFDTPDFIRINNGWMEGIGTLPNASFYDAMQLYHGQTTIQLPLERVLALHVIDAMATERGSTTEESVKAGSLVITRYAYTYAFNIASSSSIPVAFCVLALHLLMILIHLIIIATSRCPWKGSDWESFGDMLILALRSKAPIEPGDADKKHSKSRSWATPVVIKTNEDDGRQHIVVKDGSEYREASWRESNS
ncbi:hypothetical protein FIE12Z_647 [Fusarium flagelliforme]|uniref:Uncharacterized protein n=2 Tax=Fusarium flagelliforme TaxID=2675880 RepID=A0A395N532_9HYPO|nr:hypothetical protein FIE12Z_647 [Fusarium flagelliforme]